jgi:O-Antigen ligase.
VSLKHIIYWCVSAGLLLNIIYTFFYQRDLELIVAGAPYSWYTRLNFTGDVLISIASVLSYVCYRKFFPLYIRCCWIGIVLLVFIINHELYEDFLESPAIMYGPKGFGTFLNFGLLFFVANKDGLAKVQRMLLAACVVFLVLGIGNLAGLGFEFSRTESLLHVREYANYLVYVYPFFFLKRSGNKFITVFQYVFYASMLVIVLATGSRSYIIVFTLVLLVKLYYTFRKSLALAIPVLAMVTVLLTAGIMYFAQSSFFQSLETMTTTLSERSTDDSRSEQLNEFFDQYDPVNFLWGVGPLGTYYSSNVGGQYASIDNQFIFLGWWAGIPVLSLYLTFLIGSLTARNRPCRSWQDRDSVLCAKWCIFLWILAAAGLAIWVNISCHLYYYFISITIGLANYRDQEWVDEAR